MSNAQRDDNHVPSLLAVSSADGVTPVVVWADPATHRLLCQLTGSTTWYQDEVPSGTKNGSNKTFTLAHTPSNVVFLFLNGQYLVGGGTDYTRTGTSITMTVAPLSSDTLTANYS